VCILVVSEHAPAEAVDRRRPAADEPLACTCIAIGGRSDPRGLVDLIAHQLKCQQRYLPE
jgi:hypothetical protein